MRIRLLTALFFFCAFYSRIQAQVNYDSVIDSLRSLFLTADSDYEKVRLSDKLSEYYYLNTEYDSSWVYAKYELRMGKDLGIDSFIAHGYRAFTIL
ncbi:MAG: hypothetical protein AAFQ37_07505, partial [Bacteroidota bacterium]